MRANSTAKGRATGAAHHLHLLQGAPGINAHVAGDSSAPAREGTSRTASGKRRGCRTSSPSLTPSRHGPVPPVPVTTPSPQAPSAARLHYQPVAATTTSTCTSDLNCQPAEDFPHLDSYQELPQSGSGELGNAARGNTARGGAKGRPPRHSGSRGRGGSRTGRNGGRRTVATSSGRGAVASSSGGRAAAASSSGGPTTQTRFGDGMPEEEEETMGMENGSNSDSNEKMDRVGNLGRAGVEDTSTATALAVSAVLGDDDLLHEILLRIGFPNYLVHASLVCKRWYTLASSPAFLRHFREVHPPRVLGFYVILDCCGHHRHRFVPMPRLAELESVVRRARPHLDLEIFEDIDGCWNGCLLTQPSFNLIYDVRWPLDPARGKVRLPCPPENPNSFHAYDIFPSGDDHDSHFFCLEMWSKGQQTVLDVYKLSLGDSAWTIHVSVSVDLGDFVPFVTAMLVGNTICLLSVILGTPKLVLLDLGSSSFSLVELPEEAQGENDFNSQLSHVDDIIYLILVKGFQINVWTRQTDGASWLPLSSIDLFDKCRGLAKRSDMELCRGGAQAEFVHVRINRDVYLLDCKRKILDKVYELPSMPQNVRLLCLYPFLMRGMP